MNALTAFREGYPLGFCVMSGVFGSIIGSFLGVVIERLPPMLLEEEDAGNLLFPASHCPACGHVLAWWENIPLLSWCCLRGRCSHCRVAIPLRLLMVECLSALFFALTAVFAPSLPALIALWILWIGLLPLTFIDARYLLLPDCLTQPLLWAGLLFHACVHTLPLTDALYGAIAGYLSLWLVYWGCRLLTGREGLGQGDGKLFAALGAWCGWQPLPYILLLAALTGIVIYVLLYKSTGNDRQTPFGPALSLAGVIIFIIQSWQFTF